MTVMADPEPVDTVAPWTIKSVATATRNAAIQAARRENLTVGQWLEKRIAEWEGAGSPVLAPVAPAAPAPSPADTAALIQAAAAMTQAALAVAAAGDVVTPTFVKSTVATARKAQALVKGGKSGSSTPAAIEAVPAMPAIEAPAEGAG